MSNLYILRTTAKIKPSMITFFIHRSSALIPIVEKDPGQLYPESVVMLSMIFGVSTDVILDKEDIPLSTLEELKTISTLSEEEKKRIFSLRLYPNGEKLNYRLIRKILEKIQKDIKDGTTKVDSIKRSENIIIL